MDMNQMLMMLPGIQPEEFSLIQNLTKDMTDQQKQQFVAFYQGKRKDPQTILVLTVVGFFGVAGIQRFVTGEIALGILFLFTLGFCFIGTLIDVINHKRLSSNYNQNQAVETANLVKMMNQ